MHIPAAAAPVLRPPPGEDDTLVRWMLSLSPAERLQVLQGFVDSVSEVRRDQSAPLPGRP